MGLITRLFKPDNARSTMANPSDWLVEALTGGFRSNSGIAVTEETAMKFSAVYACVRVIAESIASLPLITYRRLEPRGKERATEHPLYYILHDEPNEQLTSFLWRETMQFHILLWGNGYSRIVRDTAGNVERLELLLPDRMTVEKTTEGKIYYRYRKDDGEKAIFHRHEILHIPGLGFDGLVGYTPIRMAREAIGLGLAAEAFGSRFFANDARPGVVFTYPGKLSEKAQQNIRESWEKRHKGVDNSHKAAFLEEGLDVKTIGIPPQDAQFLDTRRFQVEEIARIYRVPPHMIADLSRSTYSNIEHQSIEFVTHTIRPWLVRWEQMMQKQLFTPKERRKYFVEFLVDGLLRGDIESRYRAYKIGREGGWLSANDIREKENMNPLPPEQNGDDYWQQGPSGQQGPQRDTDENTRFFPVFSDAVERILRREEADIVREVKKRQKNGDFNDFPDWLNTFYSDHLDFAERNLLPVFKTMDCETLATFYAKRRCEHNKNLLKQVYLEAQESGLDLTDVLHSTFETLRSGIGDYFTEVCRSASTQAKKR